jgi:two-component system sensor histidine kinase BaeS
MTDLLRCRMSAVRTLFSKILLAQVVSVVLALVVVTVITRASLNRGFKAFLEKQETAVLQTLAPALGDIHEKQGGWRFLRNNPQSWQRIWRLTQPPSGRQPRGRPRPGRGPRANESLAPPVEMMEPRLLRWMMAPERGMLRERLFLLDENRSRIAGSEVGALEGASLVPIESDEQVVGWVGFTPMGNRLPPDAERFMGGQIRITTVSLALALVVAAALAFLLARNVSRPVRQLGHTVRRLSRGEYRTRAPQESRDEIGSLAGHVNQLAETLEKNRTARQRWMADIAHELRTPVAILKGEIEALADGVRQPDERTSVSLGEEVEHLSALVDDLQTLALSDAGALNIHKKQLDFSRLVRQCIESFGDRLAARGISVDTELEDPVNLYADPQRLRQMLHNLLENSSRYVLQDGNVRVTLNQQQGGAILVLEDSGPGLITDQMEQLFDRFYRVEGGRSRSGGGSGLGLAICKNIVEAHGGDIKADHSALGGLAVRISLPE